MFILVLVTIAHFQGERRIFNDIRTVLISQSECELTKCLLFLFLEAFCVARDCVLMWTLFSS